MGKREKEIVSPEKRRHSISSNKRLLFFFLTVVICSLSSCNSRVHLFLQYDMDAPPRRSGMLQLPGSCCKSEQVFSYLVLTRVSMLQFVIQLFQIVRCPYNFWRNDPRNPPAARFSVPETRLCPLFPATVGMCAGLLFSKFPCMDISGGI